MPAAFLDPIHSDVAHLPQSPAAWIDADGRATCDADLFAKLDATLQRAVIEDMARLQTEHDTRQAAKTEQARNVAVPPAPRVATSLAQRMAAEHRAAGASLLRIAMLWEEHARTHPEVGSDPANPQPPSPEVSP